MTEKQYRIHPQLRNELAKALKTEAVREALAIIQDKAKPRSTPEPRPNAHLDTLIAQEYKFKQGIQAALDTLDRLTREPELEEEKEFDERPFDHAIPDEIRRAMQQQFSQES